MLNRDNLAAFLRTRLADESPPPVAGSPTQAAFRRLAADLHLGRVAPGRPR